jgi:hypothetical protein
MVVQLPNSAGREGEIERGQEANIPLTDVHLPLKTSLGYKLMFWDTLLALSAHET